MSLPTPPWSRPPKPARPSLSQAAVVDAALAILDRDGLDAVTMRSVAQALGTGAASLYAHVGGKDDLYAQMLDRVIGEIPLPEGDPADWRKHLRQFALDTLAMFRRHDGIARVTLANVPTGPNALRTVEHMLSVLRAAGLADRDVAFAADVLALYVNAVAYEETLRGAHESGIDVEQMREYFAALPADRFPTLVSMGAVLTEGDVDERFEWGLDVLLDGLEARARPR